MTALTLGHARVVASTEGMERADWLALRRHGIGGSDAAAICGQSRYRSPLEVWLEKTGTVTGDIDNEAMFWGRTLEPIVANAVDAEEDVSLREVHALLAHPEHEWMLASIDRIGNRPDTHEPFVAEIKTAGHFAGQDWAGDSVPEAYLLQGMHYLAVCGLDHLLFGCLIAGQRLVTRWVKRDEGLIDHVVHFEAEFWQHVEDGTPPPPDGSKACTDLLAHLFDVKPGAVVTLALAEVGPLIEMRTAAAAAEKAAKATKAEAENTLKTLIGEHEEAVDAAGRRLFTWRQSDVTRIDADAVRAELPPDLLAKVTTTSTERRLVFPKRKN